MTVVIADDHDSVRTAVRRLLEGDADMVVVGEAASGPEAVALVEKLHPDVAVLDVKMPGLSGIEAARQLAERAPTTRVVILSMYGYESYVLESFRAGARAYVLKDSAWAELACAVREVLAGRRYVSLCLRSLVEGAGRHGAS